jgi:CHAT domain-containing protein
MAVLFLTNGCVSPTVMTTEEKMAWESYNQGKGEEAIAILEKTIRESGTNIERQGNLCTMLEVTRDYNNIRDCMDKLNSMLADKNAPRSGSIIESTHIKSGFYMEGIIRTYASFGVYDKAIPLAVNYLKSKEEGSPKWFDVARLLLAAYTFADDAEAIDKLNSVANKYGLEEKEEFILWSRELADAYMHFNDIKSLQKLRSRADAYDAIKFSKFSIQGKAWANDKLSEAVVPNSEAVVPNSEVSLAVAMDKLFLSRRREYQQRIELLKSQLKKAQLEYRQKIELLDSQSEKAQLQSHLAYLLKDYNSAYTHYQKYKQYELSKVQLTDNYLRTSLGKDYVPPKLPDKIDGGFKNIPLEIRLAKGEIPLLIAEKRYAEAKALLGKCTDWWDQWEQWKPYEYGAEIAIGESDFVQAINQYKLITDDSEKRRVAIQREADKINFNTDNQRYYEKLVDLYIKLGKFTEAFEYAERGKSRALVDMLASKQNFGIRRIAGNKTVDSSALLNDLKKAEAVLAAQSGPEHVRNARGLADAARAKLKSETPELAALVGVTYTPAAELRQMLRPDETLVEYYGGSDKLYAFVVTRDKIRALTLDALVLKQIQGFRQALQNPDSRDTGSFSKKLYASLISPLQIPKQGRLTVVPHGGLHYLPFAALSDGKSSLLERHSLRVLPSASVLSLLAGRKQPDTQNLLILGNPDLGQPDYDLPGAQKEAEQIASIRPNTKLLLRADASKEAVSRMGPQYGYLHFASHGIFDARKPRQSGLLLSVKPGSAEPTDGMLTVDDLYTLDLKADLVTLSACETALGSIQTGDDVIGLTRGFFFAGANSIVSTLWQVDDTATEQIMVKFYQLLPSLGKSEALRQAQLAVKAKYPHPFYWAAFQLAGNDSQSPGAHVAKAR